MGGREVFAGYLDVKVSARARRGFTPWKAWHRQWCEIRRLDDIENGAELKLKTAVDGAVVSCVVLPRSATVCRIESRSKQYAFGVFALGRSQKPLLFLSGSCESDSQKWMALIRKTLCIASYMLAGGCSFHVSIVDNAHSRLARLTGLFGILTINSQEITVNNPATGESIIKWKWHQFHQFHLQAVLHGEDENTICIFHTSREFVAGPGQLHFYCKEAPHLLEQLVTRGKCCSSNLQFAATHRLSQSEGDLKKAAGKGRDGCSCLRNLSSSDDSGVPGSSSSSNSSDCRLKSKNASGTALFAITPGGSEDDDDDYDERKAGCRIPRGESGVSLASGVYEEISEDTQTSGEHHCHINSENSVYMNENMIHLYENPEELSTSRSFSCVPPPLPPRIFNTINKSCDTKEHKPNISTPTRIGNFIRNSYKYRSNTLPAKDLRRLSQTFIGDSDYMVMMMPKAKNKAKAKNNILVPENMYVPMSPIASLKTKFENYYMVMSGKKC